jgi:hypothetical protein
METRTNSLGTRLRALLLLVIDESNEVYIVQGRARRLNSVMSSSSWNMFDNFPGASSITENLASGAKTLTREYQSIYPTLFPAHHALQKCFEKLQEIRGLLEGLSEHRRRKIQIASQRGHCLPLESLELDLERCIPTLIDRHLQFGNKNLFRLVDNYRDLYRLYEQSSMFQRSFLSKTFQIDIVALERRVGSFYTDSWVSVFQCFR